MPKSDQHLRAIRRKARARGAKRMVLQGLTLYYQSLVHRVIDDTPSYFDRVMQQAGMQSGRTCRNESGR